MNLPESDFALLVLGEMKRGCLEEDVGVGFPSLVREESILEGRWIEVTGGAQSLNPGYSYPWSHPHLIHNASGVWMHGTSDVFLQDIQRLGFNTERVFMTKDRRQAIFSARRACSNVGGNPIVIHINMDRSSKDLMGVSGDSHVIGPLPPSVISGVEKLRLRK